MVKERAARRAEREREAAARAEQRAAEAAKQARRRARRAALTRFLPRRRNRPTGPLAAKRRAQNRVVLGLAAVVQVFTWLAFSSVRLSVLVLVLTALALPVVLTLAFDRRA